MKAIALVAVLGSIASADELPTIDSQIPPALRVDAPVQLSVETGDITWVTFVLPRQDGAVAIDLPRGTQILGIELSSRDTQIWGRLLPVRAAALRAEDSAGALVTWQGSTGDEDHVVIRHVSRGCSVGDVVLPCDEPEQVSLAVILPAIDRIVIAPASGLLVDGKRSVATLAVVATAGAARPHVDADDSLFVDANDAVTRVFVAAPEVRRVRDIGKAEIRRVMQAHRPQLQGCYQAAMLRERFVAGTALLQFVIDHGRATRIDVGGDAVALRDCIAAEVASWDFPDVDNAIEVHYPITFQLAR